MNVNELSIKQLATYTNRQVFNSKMKMNTRE